MKSLFAALAFLAVAAAAQASTDSAAIFLKMAPVLQHPRCMNCHTSDPFPHQGDDQHRHTMWVARGPDDRGAPGLHCSTCHQAKNQISSGVPGAEDWHLAPLRMAWQGLSTGDLCRSLLDPAKGNMKPAAFIPHFNTPFVIWAWSPGVDQHGLARTTPPISRAEFIALTKQWIASGAKCPA